jgi:hypothetical protein
MTGRSGCTTQAAMAWSRPTPNRAVGAGVEAGAGVGDIQSGGSPVRRPLSQAPTATDPRSILRYIGEGSASRIVGLVRVT